MNTSVRFMLPAVAALLFSVSGSAQVSPPAPADAAVRNLAIQKIVVEPLRSKKTRIQGGDFDDKTDRITFNVKMTNPDTKTAITDLTAEFYVFAQGVVDRRAYQLLGKDEMPVSLAPRGTQTLSTAEVITKWDNTDARFGSRYEGWLFLLRDSAGKIVYKKATSPNWAALAEKMNTVTIGRAFDRDLKPLRTSFN